MRLEPRRCNRLGDVVIVVVDRLGGAMGSLRNLLWRFTPAIAERVRDARKSRTFRYRYHRWPDGLQARTGVVSAADVVMSPAADEKLVRRLMHSYRQRSSATPSDKWRDIFDARHGEIDAAIRRDDLAIVTAMLRDPSSNDLMFGYDGIARSLLKARRVEDRHLARQTLDNLIALTEAMGLRRLDNPEEYRWRADRVTVAEVIGQLEAYLGSSCRCPTPSRRSRDCGRNAES